ncbi:MAG: leucine-rich repeat protein [Clostridia bacterium]|nr:leucine-rich repeat protein [Clostridia bacterium]
MQVCPACDALNARPQAQGLSLDVLARATRQRLNCDFHNAEISYQQVLLEYPDEHEALWGLTLCRYGVEYVEDPRSRSRLAVVHTTRRRPMQADPDCQQACELAPPEIREQYEAEAAYIDNVQQEVRRLAETCPPYDVFLCHKTTVTGGEGYTEDYLRADALYTAFTEMGYRVFFAPKEMESVAAGSDYEAAIYHALETAKVMLLVCSSREHLTSPWVQNEWRRFLEMADEGDQKRLIPLLYGGMPPKELPRELVVRKLQAMMMGEVGVMERLAEMLVKYAGAPVNAPVAALPSMQPAFAPVQPVFAAAAPVRRPRRNAAPAAAAPAGQMTAYTAAESFETEPVSGGCRIRRFTGSVADVVIPPMIDGQRVVELGRYSFGVNTALVSIVMPQSVTEIGEFAFSNCKKLKTVVMPGVQGIGPNVFRGCSGLKEVILSDSLLSIGPNAFIDCSGLQEVILPDHLTSIGDQAFMNCKALSEIDLPASVTSVGVEAFANCTGLTYAALSEGCTTIGRMAFMGCTKLEEVVLPAGLQVIGVAAFHGCKALKGIRLPDGLARIGYAAFEKCAGLTNIVLPAGASVEGNVFRGCEALKLAVYSAGIGEEFALQFGFPYVVLPTPPLTAAKGKPELIRFTPENHFRTPKGGGSIEDCDSRDEIVRIPPFINGKPVVRIDENCFCSGKNRWISAESCLKHVEIPEGVTHIGNRAFLDCRMLQTVKLPASIQEIGSLAFCNCFGATFSFASTKNLERIGESAFRGCEKLTGRLELMAVTSLSEYAFCSTGVQEVVIGGGLESIPGMAFEDCRELKSVRLCEGVRQIGYMRVFAQCSQLEHVQLPESLEVIGLGAFSGCVGLKSIRLPKGLKRINVAAFGNCKALQEINIPEDTELERDAFHGCRKLPMGLKLKLLKRRAL